MKCTPGISRECLSCKDWFASLAFRRSSKKFERISGMNITRKLVTSLLLLVLLATEACTKKKASLPPHGGQAPTIAQTLPEEIPEETAAIETSEQAPRPKEPEQQKKPAKKNTKVTTKKATPSANTTSAAAQPATSAPAQTPPTQNPPPQNTQTVASLHPPHNNATPDTTPEMTVAAAISSDRANKQREDTTRMVDTTENKLKGLNRQLSDEEKSMRTQIETYLQQSRKATADGDYERAFNLAKKAEVLADALIKP